MSNAKTSRLLLVTSIENTLGYLINKKPAHTGTKALIKACLRQDRRAEAMLYRKFFAEAYRTCNRYLPQHADVMGVVNEGFLKVFQHLKKYNGREGALGAWIHRIMVNTAIDQIRKNKREWRIRSEELSEAESLQHAFNEGLHRMQADQVLQLVKRLPAVTRAVFNFVVVEGYNHKEVARTLEISEGTSRWHLSEAKKRLQQHIRQQDKALNETRNY